MNVACESAEFFSLPPVVPPAFLFQKSAGCIVAFHILALHPRTWLVRAPLALFIIVIVITVVGIIVVGIVIIVAGQCWGRGGVGRRRRGTGRQGKGHLDGPPVSTLCESDRIAKIGEAGGKGDADAVQAPGRRRQASEGERSRVAPGDERLHTREGGALISCTEATPKPSHLLGWRVT